MDVILPLSGVRLIDAARVGPKAAACGELLQAGFPVPAGLCLTVDAFRLALAPFLPAVSAILEACDLSHPDSVRQSAAQIAGCLEPLVVPQAVLDEVLAAVEADPSFHGCLAVRSSALDEDLPQSSQAGQYQTVLGVRGIDRLQTALVSCWRSYFSAGVLASRSRVNALAEKEGGMAVLVQPWMEPECAGVCYSLDPVRPDINCVSISAAWGAGPGVVDGSAPVDQYWISRRALWEVHERRIAEKSHEIVLDSNGSLTLAPLTPERSRAACLPDNWAVRIAEFGLAAEAALGSPQDVEWAVSGGQVWVLQSRPIASLPAHSDTAALPARFQIDWPSDSDRRRLWRLQYAPGGTSVWLPLEQDDILATEHFRLDTCRFLGAERNERVWFLNGRMYTRPEPTGLSAADRRIRRQAAADLDDRLLAQGLTTWDYWGPEMVLAVERLAAFQSGLQPHKAGPLLADHLEEALAVRCRASMIHPMISFRPHPGYLQAFRQVSGLSEPEATSAAYRLIVGGENTQTRLMDGLYALACAARHNPRLAQLVSEAQPGVWAQLDGLANAQEFRKVLQDLLDAYGERNGAGYGSESTIATPTWREQPETVLRMAAPFLDPDVLAPSTARRQAHAAVQEQVEALCRAADPAAAEEFRRQLTAAARRVTALEDHNHYLDQLSLGHLRRAALLAGERLARQGILNHREDVLWLRFAEITLALRSPEPSSLSQVVKQRQDQHTAWLALSAPPLLGLPDPALPDRPPFTDDVTAAPAGLPGTISGLGASGGTAVGPARLIFDLEGLRTLRPGDILVARNAGPAWTPYFSLIAGLVLDEGSPGQHAAASAREYGIPAVVAAKTAALHIPDGAQIAVDGTRGLVELR